MLTKEEKKLLEALKAQMDDEQKEALSEASEEEIKGFLKEARKEIEKEMFKHGKTSGDGVWAEMQEMSFKEFIEEYGEGTLIGALFAFVIIKMTRTKVGRGILIAIVIALAVAIYNAVH